MMPNASVPWHAQRFSRRATLTRMLRNTSPPGRRWILFRDGKGFYGAYPHDSLRGWVLLLALRDGRPEVTDRLDSTGYDLLYDFEEYTT